MIRWITFAALLLVSRPALSWDTKTAARVEGHRGEEWTSIYIGTYANENEHTAIARDALKSLGVDMLSAVDRDSHITVVDLNASLFRPALLEVDDGDWVRGNKRTTAMQERSLPWPWQFAGLADYSWTVHDWINRNEYCAFVPEGASNRDLCHEFQGWMGALNSSHFGSQAELNYRHFHEIALNLADRAAKMHGMLSNPTDRAAWIDFLREAEMEALTYEGVAQHFLQDRWSSGHGWERWGASEYSALPEDSRALAPMLYVGAISGLIHGHQGVTTFPDMMCSPFIDPIDDLMTIALFTRGEGDGTFIPMVGDYRYPDLRRGSYAGHSLAGVDGGSPEQLRFMQHCGVASWYEVIGRFPLNPTEEGERATRGGLGFGTRTASWPVESCFDPWATNRTMWHGLTMGIGLGAGDDMEGAMRELLGVVLEGVTHSWGRALLEEDGRWERVRLMERLGFLATFQPEETRAARGESHTNLADMANFEGVPPGNHPNMLVVSRAYEPVDFYGSNAAGEPSLPERDDSLFEGRDRHAIFGFFNRAHTDWWCEQERMLSTLRSLRDEWYERRQVEICAFLADRAYRGTDPRYAGPSREIHRHPIDTEGDPINPICDLYYSWGEDPVETERELDDDPTHLHPGYVAEPNKAASSRTQTWGDGARLQELTGHDSVANWCRRVPVLDYLIEEGGTLNRENLVAIYETGAAESQMLTGRDLRSTPGEVIVRLGTDPDDPEVPEGWFTVVLSSWTDTGFELGMSGDVPPGDFRVEIVRTGHPTVPHVESVGHFVIRVLAPEGCGDPRPCSSESRWCESICNCVLAYQCPLGSAPYGIDCCMEFDWMNPWLCLVSVPREDVFDVYCP